MLGYRNLDFFGIYDESEQNYRNYYGFIYLSRFANLEGPYQWRVRWPVVGRSCALQVGWPGLLFMGPSLVKMGRTLGGGESLGLID